jgi:hypothetical protein
MTEEGYELVMPFSVCKSQGGPYDDESFVAGWRLAEIDAALRMNGGCWQGHVYEPELKQVDLIAMRHGAHVSSEPTDAVTLWFTVTITRWPPTSLSGDPE